jgi:hypothetical protein
MDQWTFSIDISNLLQVWELKEKRQNNQSIPVVVVIIVIAFTIITYYWSSNVECNKDRKETRVHEREERELVHQ